MTREDVAKILQENITPVFQDGNGYVIHGAIDKIMSAHYKQLEKRDAQFNAVIEVCNDLAHWAAGHKLGQLNDWLDRYGNEDFTINWRKILTERKLL